MPVETGIHPRQLVATFVGGRRPLPVVSLHKVAGWVHLFGNLGVTNVFESVRIAAGCQKGNNLESDEFGLPA